MSSYRIVTTGDERKIQSTATPVDNKRISGKGVGCIEPAIGKACGFRFGSELHMLKASGKRRLLQFLTLGGREIDGTGDGGSGDWFSLVNQFFYLLPDIEQIFPYQVFSSQLPEISIGSQIHVNRGIRPQLHLESPQVGAGNIFNHIIGVVPERKTPVRIDKDCGRNQISTAAEPDGFGMPCLGINVADQRFAGAEVYTDGVGMHNDFLFVVKNMRQFPRVA